MAWGKKTTKPAVHQPTYLVKTRDGSSYQTTNKAIYDAWVAAGKPYYFDSARALTPGVDPKSLAYAYDQTGNLVSATSPRAVQQIDPSGKRIPSSAPVQQPTILPTYGYNAAGKVAVSNQPGALTPPTGQGVKPITTATPTAGQTAGATATDLVASSQLGTAATTSGILRGLPNPADTQTLSETSGGTVPPPPSMTSRDKIMGPSTEEQIAADKARLANIEAEKEKARVVVPPKVVRQETVGQTVYDVYDNGTRQINQGATSALQAQALQAQREAEAKAQREAPIKAENDRIAREKKVQTDAIARQQQADIERNTPLGARRGRNAAWQSAIGGAASGVGAQRTF